MATNIVSNRLNSETVDLVTTVHPDYRRMINSWRFYRDSYIGGQDYQEGLYLTRYQFESEEEYRMRILQTPLDNHCKSVIHVYNSFIFQNPIKRYYGSIENDPGLEPFLEDADLEGRSLDAFMRDVNVQSSIYGNCWIIVDKPNTQANTRAEELQQGIRPYVSIVTPENVLDWQYERQSNGLYTLSYLKILENDDYSQRRPQNTVFTREYFPDRVELRMYDRDHETGRTLETIANPIGRIPAVCVYASRSGARGIGVSDIADVALMQRAIYDELSEIEQLIRISNHPSLVSTIDVQAAAGAGARIIMPDNQDSGLKPYLLQPSSQNLAGIMESIQKKVEAIDKMANMGTARGNTARTLSGVAMDTEFRQLNVRLAEKADNLEYAEEQMWRLWCLYQATAWDGEVNYPNSFNIRDRQIDLDLAKKSVELDPNNPYIMRAVRTTISETITDDQELQQEIEEFSTDLATEALSEIAEEGLVDGCPLPMTDKQINIANHLVCVAEANLGPASVTKPGVFWMQRADRLGISTPESMSQQCQNCGYYVDNKLIKGCFDSNYPANIPVETEVNPAWEVTGLYSGYCTKWDITCTPIRTCDTWKPGGPITN